MKRLKRTPPSPPLPLPDCGQVDSLAQHPLINDALYALACLHGAITAVTSIATLKDCGVSPESEAFALPLETYTHLRSVGTFALQDAFDDLDKLIDAAITPATTTE